ncbi:MAG: hypothetical protein BGO83_03815 [Devosia sp. 66-14]|nr:MAG: hypothetical protein ABS47_09575 [Devosia sp. SCN 66-27]OJX23986.1 MAG: hypothetical protein BGO83_03815 [Devosia sp. 66-14]
MRLPPIPRPAGPGGVSRDSATGRRTAPFRAGARPFQQVGRFYAEHFGEAVDDVDSCGIDAALERTDIGSIDAGTMGELLLRQPSRTALRLQIVCQYLSYLHVAEDTAL